MQKVRKLSRVVKLNFGLYKDVPIFLLLMLVFCTFISILSYWYCHKNLNESYTVQLMDARNILTQGVMRDLAKLKNYTETIANEIQKAYADKKISTNLLGYSNKIQLNLVNNFKLCIIRGGIYCEVTPENRTSE